MGKKVVEDRARRRGRRSFTSEFKAEVVELVRKGDRTVPTLCRELDLRWPPSFRPISGLAKVEPAGCSLIAFCESAFNN